MLVYIYMVYKVVLHILYLSILYVITQKGVQIVARKTFQQYGTPKED